MEQKTKVAVETPPKEKHHIQEPGEFIESYRQQHRELSSTYEWLKGSLSAEREAAWQR